MLSTATKSSQQQSQSQRKKKQQHQQGDKLSSSSSPTWLLNWFSQLTKPSLKSSSSSSNSSISTTPSVILPWKNSHKSSPSSSVVITDPINVPTIKYTPSSEHVNRPEKRASTQQQQQQQQQQDQHRPSITISLTPSVVSSERRNSQQTISSSFTTSDDQYSTTAASYYQRRDSSERSILSELWSKARRRHPHYPRFHWPHRHAQSLGSSPQQQPPYMRVQPPTTDDSIAAAQAAATSCPSSYRHQHYFPRHFKRHSISSLMTSADNTPSGSRPNSVVLSQPTSPNFAALLVKRQNEDDDVDNYWLSDEDSCSCQVLKKERWVIKHELIKLAVDGLFSIPEMVTLSSSIEKHVLQIGCGDAAWSIDVAIQYPKWIVVGLDDGDGGGGGGGGMNGLSFKRSIPRNFKFIRRNSILQGLKNLPDGTFDFIAFRLLLLGYTFEQYQALMTECLRVCKPGGYIEVMEMDMRIYHQRTLSVSITQLLNNEVISAIESQSLDPRLARRLQDLVADEEEKTHTEVKYISLPLGVWGGRLGVMFRDDIHALIESYQPEIADASQKPARSEAELDYKMELMDHELDSNRAFMNLHLMVMQKAMP